MDWVQISSPPIMSHHSFAFALNNAGYIVCGTTPNGNTDAFFKYTNNLWSQLYNFPGGARGYGIGDTEYESAYFGFGVDSYYFNDIWKFTEEKGWELVTNCPCSGRAHPAFVVTDNNKLYVGMGNDNSGDLQDTWRFDIDKQEWQQLSDMLYKAHHPYQFHVNNIVYFGFGHSGDNIYNRFSYYDDIQNIWIETQNLPNAEGRVAGTQQTYKNCGYILSGEGEYHTALSTSEFWRYDPNSSNVWTKLKSSPGMGRWAPASFILNNAIFILNGMIRTFSSTEWENTAFKLNLNNGDQNNDDNIDVLDVVVIVGYILLPTYIENADLNNDGEVNVLDILALVSLILRNQ